jgi:RNA polymerase sigma-70 factor (ECF subfamily)
MRGPEADWVEVLRRALAGDRLALARASRLINGFLAGWNAYDFRDDWDDLVQEVLSAAVVALRDGRLRDPAALVGYLRSTTRFKYLDRLRRHLGQRRSERLPWAEVVEERARAVEHFLGAEVREDLQRALDRIPEKRRNAVMAVYVAGFTYEEAAQACGIPLGTLKRYLRDGLAQLRAELADRLDAE